MSRASKEIECLKKLDDLTSCYDEMLDFLHKEDLITREEAKAIRSSSEIPKMVHTKLSALSRSSDLQLLEYEWTILPVERIKIVVVTNRNSKEFTYNY